MTVPNTILINRVISLHSAPQVTDRFMDSTVLQNEYRQTVGGEGVLVDMVSNSCGVFRYPDGSLVRYTFTVNGPQSEALGMAEDDDVSSSVRTAEFKLKIDRCLSELYGSEIRQGVYLRKDMIKIDENGDVSFLKRDLKLQDDVTGAQFLSELDRCVAEELANIDLELKKLIQERMTEWENISEAGSDKIAQLAIKIVQRISSQEKLTSKTPIEIIESVLSVADIASSESVKDSVINVDGLKDKLEAIVGIDQKCTDTAQSCAEIATTCKSGFERYEAICEGMRTSIANCVTQLVQATQTGTDVSMTALRGIMTTGFYLGMKKDATKLPTAPAKAQVLKKIYDSFTDNSQFPNVARNIALQLTTGTQ